MTVALGVAPLRDHHRVTADRTYWLVFGAADAAAELRAETHSPTSGRLCCVVMSSLSGFVGMEGVGWQRLCIRVLAEEHGTELVPVPDHDRGDAGLEAFTLSGLAYQCYSPQSPLSTAQRYDKVRDKITADVGKFITKKRELTALLGTVQIRYWILLTPLVDTRQVLEHAVAQTERVRSEGLSYASSGIHVLVQTLDQYEGSLNAVANRQLSRLDLPPVSSPDYASVAGDDVDKMRLKLSKIPALADAESRHRYVDLMLTSYLGGRELRDYIRDHFPDLDNELCSLIDDLEVRLESEYPLHGHAPDALLLRVKQDAEERVCQALLNVKPGDSRMMAEGQIAEWLMRCPLDFPGAPIALRKRG